ncbi:MAG: sulfotransferase [Pseudomonadales bacterium]|nr:sulfotransferase [Pseudomonadales bacterium]NRA16386.1 sulfotransferase [Oceanospirillaceae bacterium]
MSDINYSFFDLVLHKLALDFNSIAELSFEFDQRSIKTNSHVFVDEKHVFVSGLARAGTTILMRRFYSGGQFHSLTYRDMPFVLAPNLWKKITASSKREMKAVERAHGDNILVNFDSPESFEEVFWRVFTGDDYISTRHLSAHNPDDEIIQRFRDYVGAILASHDNQYLRYLSKNNNSILRLNAIKKSFPNAVILIPFRDPIQQAYSLLTQHRHFCRLQAEDNFTLSYMEWLGHYEFGLGHKPFVVGDNKTTEDDATHTLQYWVQLWCNVYKWLETTKPASAKFVCYEDLCTLPESWKAIANFADVSDDIQGDTPFELKPKTIEDEVEQDLVKEANEIYERLVCKSRLLQRCEMK